MAEKTVGKPAQGPTASSPKEILSIQLRPDGLSFAYRDGEETVDKHISRQGSEPATGWKTATDSPEWPAREFDRVIVCAPTDQAVVVPATIHEQEQQAAYLESLGYRLAPDTQFVTNPAGSDSVVLFAVEGTMGRAIGERFETVEYTHPLAINLMQPATKETVLRVDRAAGYGAFTLHQGQELLFADVIPIGSDADLLLTVNRIIVTGKVGAFRIVCSGDRAEETCALLAAHYRQVGIHGAGESRNLLHPFS